MLRLVKSPPCFWAVWHRPSTPSWCILSVLIWTTRTAVPFSLSWGESSSVPSTQERVPQYMLAIIFIISILTLLSLLNKFPTRAWHQNPLVAHTPQSGLPEWACTRTTLWAPSLHLGGCSLVTVGNHSLQQPLITSIRMGLGPSLPDCRLTRALSPLSSFEIKTIFLCTFSLDRMRLKENILSPNRS